MLLNSKKSLKYTMLTLKCFQKMTKRDLVVAEWQLPDSTLRACWNITRDNRARLLWSKRDFLRILQIYLHYLLSFLHFEIPYMYTRGEAYRMPQRVLASGPQPCGGNYTGCPKKVPSIEISCFDLNVRRDTSVDFNYMKWKKPFICMKLFCFIFAVLCYLADREVIIIPPFTQFNSQSCHNARSKQKVWFQ